MNAQDKIIKITDTLKPFGFELDHYYQPNKETLTWIRFKHPVSPGENIVFMEDEFDNWHSKVVKFLVEAGRDKFRLEINHLLGNG